MKFYSPLRYPGGKGKLSKFIQLIIEDNSLLDGYYIEPYAGGASVALSLLFNEYVTNIVINDLDKSIYAFWYSVLNYTDEICKLIKDTKINLGNWKKNKKIQSQKNNVSLLKLGFSTFYLNRTNRSGIINGGVIGGLKQQGLWKIDARFNKEDLISRILKIADYKDRIKLYNLDACKLVNKLINTTHKKTLFYFDPPYYLKGKELYVNYYVNKDHKKVSNMIKSLSGFKWMVTYDNHEEIKQLYKPYRKFEYTINYSASITAIGSEVMFFSNNLLIPKVKNPTKMKLLKQ